MVYYKQLFMQQDLFKWLEDYTMDFCISKDVVAPLNYTNVSCCIRS